MKHKKFKVRIQITEFIYPVVDFLKYNLDILKQDSGIDVEIIFWYDRQMMDISPIFKKHISSTFEILENDIRDHYPKNIKNAMFNILYSKFDDQQKALSEVENDSKFYLFYDSESSFIKSIVEFFSFIKAKLNYEVTKNENRHSRK